MPCSACPGAQWPGCPKTNTIPSTTIYNVEPYAIVSKSYICAESTGATDIDGNGIFATVFNDGTINYMDCVEKIRKNYPTKCSTTWFAVASDTGQCLCVSSSSDCSSVVAYSHLYGLYKEANWKRKGKYEEKYLDQAMRFGPYRNGDNATYTPAMCQAACNDWSATSFAYFGILLGQYCVCDFDLENIVKHGKLINKGFELYETINIHSVYIQNNAVHYDWVGANVAPLSTPFLGEDIDFKGKWQHIVVQFDGTSRYIYVNGQLRAKDVPNATISAVPFNHMNIGHYNFDSFFNGWIGQVLMWQKMLDLDEINMLYKPSPCNSAINPFICVSACDGSISFPNHLPLDFESMAEFQNPFHFGIEVRQTRWSPSKRRCNDELVWPTFRWTKILQYHDKYIPTSSAVLSHNLQNPPSVVGFSKLSDVEINSMKSFNGYSYFKIEQEFCENKYASSSDIASCYFFLRTKNAFVDTQQSFGWKDSYETCHADSIEVCDWQPGNKFQYSSHFTAFSGEFNSMWTVDHGGSVNCFGIDLNQRCFSYGLTWVPIVSIGDAYTPNKEAVGDIQKVLDKRNAGFAKISDESINSIQKKILFEELTSGSPKKGISRLNVMECKLYASSNKMFSWGSSTKAPVGDYDFIGCYRYSSNHGTRKPSIL